MIVDWSTAHGETAPDRHTDSISRGEVALSTTLQRTETHSRPGAKNEHHPNAPPNARKARDAFGGAFRLTASFIYW
jgi:hypothetical protein